MMTYKSLVHRMTTVACVLQAVGVGPDDVVGILMNRGCDLVAALLGKKTYHDELSFDYEVSFPIYDINNSRPYLYCYLSMYLTRYPQKWWCIYCSPP
jgi:hypothetical protein